MRPLLVVVVLGLVLAAGTPLVVRLAASAVPLGGAPRAVAAPAAGAGAAGAGGAPGATAGRAEGTGDATQRAAGGVAAAGPPVVVETDVQRYAVAGGDVPSVLRSLQAGGPQIEGHVYFGLTVAESEYRFRYREARQSCTTADARVTLRVGITLPAWRPDATAPPELRADWARFEAALRRHEEGHRSLAVDGAHRLQQAVQSVSAATCDAAADRAGQAAARIQIETEARHRAYDETTRHGETQGAVWGR